MTHRISVVAAVAAGLLGATACHGLAPPVTPEQSCVAHCREKMRACTAVECERGCNGVLDRLVEGEGSTTLACVAKETKRCDDRLWAWCAVRTGPYVNGGPPPPPPPSDDWDEAPAPAPKKNDDELL